MFFVITSFITSILSGLGVGSGGLLIIFLTFFEKYSQHEAQGINLAFLVTSGGVSSFFNLKNGSVLLSNAVILSLFGIVGCLFGCFLSFSISRELLGKIFGFFLVFSGLLGIFPFVKKMLVK